MLFLLIFGHQNNTYNDFTYNDFTYNDFTYNDFTYNDFTHDDFTYNDFTYNDVTNKQAVFFFLSSCSTFNFLLTVKSKVNYK